MANHLLEDNPNEPEALPTLMEFATLVQKMRDLQNRYFKTRNMTTLAEARDMERRCDSIVNAILDNQLSIF